LWLGPESSEGVPAEEPAPLSAGQATQGFSVPVRSDEKKKISNSFPTMGIGKKSKNCFKETTRKALKKKRKK